jgi:HlyD family secretion protein
VRVRMIAVMSLALAVLVGVSACGSPAPAAPTTTVRRGSVAVTASADGAISGVANGPGSVVVVPFEEAAAANITPNQRARVSFDAVPDLVLDATVVAVAPTGVSISGVTNYYVTVALTQGDPRLRAGQTATVSVITRSVDNVLVVPNAAVSRSGGNSYVNVPGPDGAPVPTRFEPGLVGDENTQVLSGLTEGQTILLPPAHQH